MEHSNETESSVGRLSLPKRIAFAGIAMGLGLALLLILAELGLRIAGFQAFRGGSHTMEDSELSWINKISAEVDVRGPDFSFEVHTNSLGLRGPELKPETQRILLLGDSYTFGYGVDDDETFAARLQHILKHEGPDGWEVVNGGVSGFGAMQSHIFARRIWDDIEPRIVIYTHCGNDFGDDLRFSRGTYRIIRNRLPGRRFLKENSVVYNLAKPLVLGALSKLGVYNPEIEFEAGNEGALVSKLGETWEKGRDLTCAALGDTQRDVRERGAEFLVTTVGFWSTEDGVRFSSDAQAVIDCVRELGVPFLDPRLAFPPLEKEPWNNGHSAGHLSPLGNRLFAESLNAGIREKGLLDGS